MLLVSQDRQAGAIPAAKEEWTRVRTKHFTLIGDANPKDITRVGVAMERFRAVIEGEDETYSVRSLLPTTIVAFKNDESFARYKRGTDGVPADYVGVFTAGRDGNAVGLNVDSDDTALETVYHEYVHYFLDKRYLDVPLWVNEGMAEFYSTFRAEKNRIEIGQPIEQHVRLLRAVPLMPFVYLFADQPWSEDYHHGIQQGVFYAESWALYHYIMRGRPELRPHLVEFLDKLAGGARVHAAFVESFGVDYEVIEAELRHYIAEGLFSYQRIELDEMQVDESVTVERLPRAELLYALAEYQALVTPWQEREIDWHLREAIDADPKYARPHASLACLLDRRGKGFDAAEEFERAIACDPKDDLPQYLFAMHKLQAEMESIKDFFAPRKTLPKNVKEARELFSGAVKLNPDRVESRVGLGLTYFFDPGDPAEGIAALEWARSMEPSRMDVPFWLMILHLRAGNREEAGGLAKRVLVHARDQRVFAAAQFVLMMDDMSRIQQKAEEVQLDMEAEQQQKGIMSRDRAIRAVDEEIRSAAVRRQQAIDYNTAVHLVKAGEVDKAMAILERLEKAPLEPRLAKMTRELLGELRGYQARERGRQAFERALDRARSGDIDGAIVDLEGLKRQAPDQETIDRLDRAILQLRALAAEQAQGAH